MKWALIAVPALILAGACLCGTAQALPQPLGRGVMAAPPSPALLPVRHHRHFRHDRSRRSGAEAADAHAGASAGAGTIKPGEWQFSAQLQTEGGQLPPAGPQSTAEAMPTGALKSTYRSCIAADQAVPAAFGPGCILDGVQRDGARLTWSMTCTNRQNAVRSDGTAQYRGDTMAATMVSHLPAGPGATGGEAKLTDLTQHITGRYLGPCPRLAQGPQTPIIPPRATLAAGAGSGSSAQWVEPAAASPDAAPSAGSAEAPPPPAVAAAPPAPPAAAASGSTAAPSAAPPAPEPAVTMAAPPERAAPPPRRSGRHHRYSAYYRRGSGGYTPSFGYSGYGSPGFGPRPGP